MQKTSLVRVLEFHLADSHIMCRPDQVQEEFLAVLDLVQYVMATLGLTEDCSYRASLHDPLKDKFDDADWDEAETPYVNVARITIPAPQRRVDSERRAARCENLVFTPWHSLAEHRPLGSINRLRKAVYLASEGHRGAGAKSGSGQ